MLDPTAFLENDNGVTDLRRSHSESSREDGEDNSSAFTGSLYSNSTSRDYQANAMGEVQTIAFLDLRIRKSMDMSLDTGWIRRRFDLQVAEKSWSQKLGW